MDHDLVPLAGCPRIDAVVERRLSEQRQRICPLLRHRRRFRRSVRGKRFRGNVFVYHAGRTLALIQGLACRGQSLLQDRARLRLEPPADDHHTVFVLIHMQRTAAVAPIALSRFGDAIHPPPAADDPLDVLGGAGPADSEQPLFGLRRSDAGQRADFRIRQLAAGERAGQQRQRAERQRDANALAGGAGIEADAPRQPRGARTEAVGPAAARVEFSDEIEEVRRRGVQMRRQVRDLVAEAIQRLDGASGGLGYRSDADTRGRVHRRVSLHLCADSIPRF